MLVNYPLVYAAKQAALATASIAFLSTFTIFVGLVRLTPLYGRHSAQHPLAHHG